MNINEIPPPTEFFDYKPKIYVEYTNEMFIKDFWNNSKSAKVYWSKILKGIRKIPNYRRPSTDSWRLKRLKK